MRVDYEIDVAWPQQDNCFVHCFSKTPYSNPMWGHYGDCHQGICIEYDASKLLRSDALLMPVVYSDKPLDASRLVDERIVNGGVSPLLFKSRDWAYEREWRMFLPKRAEDEGASSRFLDFGESAITGIYVGINHSPEAFAAVDAIPESGGIAKHQIERSYMSYELTSDTFEDLRAGKRKGLLL